MSIAKTKIGIVTTGHGPRDEYIHYHSSFLEHLGAEVTVVTRHALEGLNLENLRPHFVDGSKPNIGAHIHFPGATGNQYGPGWDHPFLELGFAVERMQDAVEKLEHEDKVDIIVLACAAEIPVNAIHTELFLLHPRGLMFSLAEHLVNWTGRRLRFGILTNQAHAEMDRQDWFRRSWVSEVDLFIAPVTDSVEDAAAELGEQGIDLGFYFGYGAGLAPFAPKDRLKKLCDVVKAPIIFPHWIATLFLRNLVVPCIDDATFMPVGWWQLSNPNPPDTDR